MGRSAPDHYTEADLAYIVPRVLDLTYTARDLATWAKELGHSGPPFRPDRSHILGPSGVTGNDYPRETFRVLKNGELRGFGEYRTYRLVLAAWDTLEEGTLS
jgi:hypothetical protein